MAITTNLHQALHRIRDPHRIRCIWADSICINQDGLEEKAYQVASMVRIFARAQRVIIYVGMDNEDHGMLARTLAEDVQTMLSLQLGKINTVTSNAMPFPQCETSTL